MEPVRYEPATGTLWVAHIVYALHSLSIVTGMLTASSIVDRRGVRLFNPFGRRRRTQLLPALRCRGDVSRDALCLADPNLLVRGARDGSHFALRDSACHRRHRFCSHLPGVLRSGRVGGLPDRPRMGETFSRRRHGNLRLQPIVFPSAAPLRPSLPAGNVCTMRGKGVVFATVAR